MRGDRQTAKNLYDSFINSDNENYKKYAQQLDAKFGLSRISNNNINKGLTYVPSTRQKLATVFPNNSDYKQGPPIESMVWNPNYNWKNDWYFLYNSNK